ncbi:zinc finger CCCH domain-containing protein 18-like isoform X2 [Dreissena polymorpha]|uniref:zinc finger CCCH domain-containing protein 18-like isoform X2 n=1 Tax=Dreissena polymorpha TaxID=45954 RepID=UPI002265056A|nr:zinc finger CCCH domain-containing protein 18-like isoform X2 [Dreissena polymorpha]
MSSELECPGSPGTGESAMEEGGPASPMEQSQSQSIRPTCMVDDADDEMAMDTSEPVENVGPHDKNGTLGKEIDKYDPETGYDEPDVSSNIDNLPRQEDSIQFDGEYVKQQAEIADDKKASESSDTKGCEEENECDAASGENVESDNTSVSTDHENDSSFNESRSSGIEGQENIGYSHENNDEKAEEKTFSHSHSEEDSECMSPRHNEDLNVIDKTENRTNLSELSETEDNENEKIVGNRRNEYDNDKLDLTESGTRLDETYSKISGNSISGVLEKKDKNQSTDNIVKKTGNDLINIENDEVLKGTDLQNTVDDLISSESDTNVAETDNDWKSTHNDAENKLSDECKKETEIKQADSYEEDKEVKESLSGMEDVSDDETDLCEDEAITGKLEKSNVSDDKAESGMEEVSDDEEMFSNNDDSDGEIVDIQTEKRTLSGIPNAKSLVNSAETNNYSSAKLRKRKEGEESAEEGEASEDGMEEVSDEEEGDFSDIEDKSARKSLSRTGGVSEDGVQSGVEEVSSDESDVESDSIVSSDEEPQKETESSKSTAKDKSRSVEIKENGETVTIDDTGKDDGVIVKEILQNMTIKIDNVPDIKEAKEDTKTKASVHTRKTRDSKDRRDTTKSKAKTSSGHKDVRDIGERLKSQASYGEDVELDYDDTVHDDSKDKQGSESEGEIVSGSSSDGEISEEDCEEGEIREPGQKIFLKPTCRFFMRGHCTWGINCRFIHPGINDKGNYQLIERPGFNNRPPPPPEEKFEEEERSPSPEPPPPPPEPKEETAWERGLRQAKEMRKKALERREMETNFEQKKLNLSIDDNPEYDKENKAEVKSPVKKQPYYDKYEPLSDDEYYDQTPIRQQQRQIMEESWGQYENFEVRWMTRDSSPPPHPLAPGRFPHPGDRYPPPPYGELPPPMGHRMRGRPPSPRRYSRSPPPMPARYMRGIPTRDPRMLQHREKVRERMIAMSPPPPTDKISLSQDGQIRADEWHDPWRRSNANKGKSPEKRSGSGGRRQSRRSYSYSSSYSSRSRSRSSSYSSISSRSSSRSTSLSRSRSPVKRPRGGMVPRGARHAAAPMPGQPDRRLSQGEPPMRGQPMRSPEKRPGAGPISPNKGLRGQQGMPGPHGRVQGPRRPDPPSQQIVEAGRSRRSGPQRPGQLHQNQKKFQMEVKTRDRPLPPSAFGKQDHKQLPPSAIGKQRPVPPPRGRSGSSSSGSRSGSRSSSSSASSFSSGSSYSRSRSGSSSSSSSRSPGRDQTSRGGLPARGEPGARGYRQPGPGRPPMPGRGAERPRQPAGGFLMSRGGPDRMKIGETSRPATVQQSRSNKDPMKATGQKSNIKLTLIKPGERPSDRPSAGGDMVSRDIAARDMVTRKRPPEPPMEPPPSKRPAMAAPPKSGERPMKKAEKPVPVSPTKAAPRPVSQVRMPAGKVPQPAPPVPTATAKKKSTVSRREELLKQLKAVEDAIAKKKKKMT